MLVCKLKPKEGPESDLIISSGNFIDDRQADGEIVYSVQFSLFIKRQIAAKVISRHLRYTAQLESNSLYN